MHNGGVWFRNTRARHHLTPFSQKLWWSTWILGSPRVSTQSAKQGGSLNGPFLWRSYKEKPLNINDINKPAIDVCFNIFSCSKRWFNYKVWNCVAVRRVEGFLATDVTVKVINYFWKRKCENCYFKKNGEKCLQPVKYYYYCVVLLRENT
jgi:hypothetical protein